MFTAPSVITFISIKHTLCGKIIFEEEVNKKGYIQPSQVTLDFSIRILTEAPDNFTENQFEYFANMLRRCLEFGHNKI